MMEESLQRIYIKSYNFHPYLLAELYYMTAN